MKSSTIFISCLFFAFSAFSQTKTSNSIGFVFKAGAGVYTTIGTKSDVAINGKGSNGLSYLLSSTFSCKKHMLTIRYLKHDEYFNFTSFPLEVFSDAGVLYGRNFYTAKKARLNLFAGAGFVKGIIRGKYTPGESLLANHYEAVRIFVPALLQEAELMFYPSKYFGWGVSVTGNINSKNSHVAGFFKIAVGKSK